MSVKDRSQKKPQLEEFIQNRDFAGAITCVRLPRPSPELARRVLKRRLLTKDGHERCCRCDRLLNFNRQANPDDETILPWITYCHFHSGHYKKALECCEEQLKQPDFDPLAHTYKACCLFFLGMYKEAEEAALAGPSSRLQNRLLFHISHKFNDETKLMQVLSPLNRLPLALSLHVSVSSASSTPLSVQREARRSRFASQYHERLEDKTDDQLSLASIHYLRSHFQEATDIYKKLLMEHREYLALNVYAPRSTPLHLLPVNASRSATCLLAEPELSTREP